MFTPRRRREVALTRLASRELRCSQIPFLLQGREASRLRVVRYCSQCSLAGTLFRQPMNLPPVLLLFRFSNNQLRSY
jgi:hypothetical protein